MEVPGVQIGWPVGHAYELAMQIDRVNTGVGIYEAIQAAVWTRSLDRVGEVAGAVAENEVKGVLPDGVAIFIEAAQAALSGDLVQAADRFIELIELWAPVVLEEDLAIIQTAFAMLVGLDHPAAAAAAQAAYDWLSSTGTTCLMDVWVDGLPETADLGGAAAG